MLNTYSLLTLMFFTCTLHAQNSTNSGTIKIESGGSISCKSNFTNTGVLSGSLNVEGNLSNSGALASDTAAGVTMVKGDYTAKPGTVQKVGIGGTISSSYSQLNVSGNVFLNGTLSAALIRGFTPSESDPDLTIITGIINGRFTTVNIPSQYVLVYNSNNVVLRSRKANEVTGIEPLSPDAFGIQYFPNPVIDRFTIDRLRIIDGWTTVEILNANGSRVVDPQQINNRSKLEINLTSLRPGLHFAVIRNKKGMVVYIRFVKI